MIKKQVLIGDQINNVIDEIAALRIHEFAKFPYLYDGTLEYEREYLQLYSGNPDAIFITLRNEKNSLVGMLTACPFAAMVDFLGDARAKYLADNKKPKDYFYYGEIIILPDYRKELNLNLAAEVDRHALKSGYKKANMMTVVRQDDHKLKPDNYKSLDPLFSRLGFKKTGITTEVAYNTFISGTDSRESTNTMVFWEKEFF
ncbi:MAG: hypothetical protein JXA66_07865 [Oligoflexia bacterium]|nr:hypothetical protein [Oligoflexia bacterium]